MSSLTRAIALAISLVISQAHAIDGFVEEGADLKKLAVLPSLLQ